MMAIWGFALIVAPPLATWAFQIRAVHLPGRQGALVFYLACCLLAVSLAILRERKGRALPAEPIDGLVESS
jgi:hypothetical protein